MGLSGGDEPTIESGNDTKVPAGPGVGHALAPSELFVCKHFRVGTLR
jgi:hypothetical protein